MTWFLRNPYFNTAEDLTRGHKNVNKVCLRNFVREMWLTRCNRKNTAHCDQCKEKINFKDGCYNCKICRYDECSKCSGYYKIKEQREKAKKLALGLKVEDGEEGKNINADGLE